MGQFLAYGIVGLSTAAIYAVIGSGLVLTYTTTGVFNFAHGAAGMLAAFTYWQLTIGWGWPVPVALAVVLFVAAPAFGLGVERFVMRPVQALGDMERLVVTVAMLSGLIGVAEWIWNPNVPRTLPTFFANAAPIRIGSVTITWHQAITMIVAAGVAVALWILLQRTRTGAEMRAVVDDRSLAGLTGADPLRASRVAWILGTQLAAIGGILIAPELTLDATQLSLLVFPHRRLRGRSLRLRPVPVPTAAGTAVFAAVTVAAGVVLAATLSPANLVTYGGIFSLGLVALSYVPLTGYAGQISLCQLSIAGVGAVVWAHLGGNGQWWALLAVIAVCAAVGAVVAVPALRLSGIYLALGTAAFAFVLDQWIFTLPSFRVLGVQVSLFNGGSVTAVGPRLFGVQAGSEAALTVLAAVFLALLTLAVAALRRGRFGRRLIALRDSEAAYAMLGGNLLLARVAVFALAAGIAGLGGALYAMQQQSVTSTQFTFQAGLPIFLVAVVGGLSSVGTG